MMKKLSLAVLLSATGELVTVHPDAGTWEVVNRLRRPSILGTRNAVLRQALMMPEASYWGQAEKPVRQARSRSVAVRPKARLP